MIFESGKNGANLVTSCRNYTCWTILSFAARENLVTFRPGGSRRKEGYVIATRVETEKNKYIIRSVGGIGMGGLGDISRGDQSNKTVRRNYFGFVRLSSPVTS